MNVLSLFNGMSCGYLATLEAGIGVDSYISSEVEPNSIKVSQLRFPDIKQIGDICNVHVTNLGIEIDNQPGGMRVIGHIPDLLIGGSPCQDLRPGRAGLSGSKSKLFFEYVRVLNEAKLCNPNVLFLFENVSRASKADQKVISDLLGAEPIEINASLVSAQNRKRLYWTNIPGVTQPKDLGVTISDILETEVPEKYYLSEKAVRYINRDDRIKKAYTAINGNKALTLQRQYSSSINGTFLCVDCNGRIDADKANTLSHRYNKGVENFGSNPFLFDGVRYRKFTPVECERLQCVPDNFTAGVADSHRYGMLGNGWNIKAVSHILSFIK